MMTSYLRYNDSSKGPVKTRSVQGMNFVEDMLKRVLSDESVEEHIEGVKNFSIRDDDILLCAYAKCGMFLVFNSSTSFSKN